MAELVAIVTGASQGIGRATAVRLAKDFSGVTLAARSADALRDVAAEVEKTGADSLSVPLDLRDKESAEALVKKTLERFGRIDALLNIAGTVPQINLFEMTDEQWRDGLELKLHGARRLTVLAWEALKAIHTRRLPKFPSRYSSGAGRFFASRSIKMWLLGSLFPADC
jgi:3-oxoacyl-[acyl-carrier protein] reductase